MNSVDDSSVVTPAADTSNLSSPDSTSSEFSQPTVKLRVNESPKNRIFTADGDDPFLQTLDKEGRHLVETTGRTAQKSRASIRDASRYNEKCELHGEPGDCWPSYSQPRKCRSSTSASSFERHVNRRVKKRHSYGSESSRRSRREKSETKESPTIGKSGQPEKWKMVDEWPVNHQPRKCHSSSSASSLERHANRRVKKRHSYGAESGKRRSWEKSELKETPPKRYSAGDYLRQQILADLNSNELEGKTDEQIAEDRCNRVKAYLRRRGADSSYVAPETRLMELREWTKLGHSTASAKANRRKDLDRVRNYLQEKIRSRMNEDEKWENDRVTNRSRSSDYVSELSVQDIKSRYPNYKVDRLNFPTRRVRSDINVRQQELPSSSDSGQTTEFWARKSGQRRGNPCRRTRSEIVPEMLIDYDDNEIKTRFYSFLGGRRNSWKTKSGVTFEKKLSLPNKTTDDVNVDRESDEVKNDEKKNNSRDLKKYCRRTKSENTVSEKLMERNKKERSVSWSDKRKLRRKTSSTKVAVVLDSTSVDSEVDTTNRRRVKGQQVGSRSLCSWREYKERRRQEQLRKELVTTGGGEKTRRNASNTMDTFRKSDNDASRLSEEKKRDDRSERYPFANYRATDDATKTNENRLELVRSSDNANDTETETILQENYLLLDLEENQSETNVGSPTISRLQVNEYANPENSLFRHEEIDYEITSEIPRVKSPRFGYNLKSNVKKSDTFKIVDGSEKIVEQNDSGPFFGGGGAHKTFGRHSEGEDSAGAGQTNKDIATDYFRRVYELLGQRQEEARRGEGPGISAPRRRDSDTTSTANCCYERDELLRKRRRRRKKDKNSQGEDVVAVSAGVRGDDDWRVQQLLVNNDPENLIFRRPQLQNTGQKRPRHPAPPIPANCKINAKDISKYFDYPNKKNSPRNGTDENGRSKRNELIEEQQQQQVDSNEAAMGSNLSRHNGKGLTGRRTQSSGNLCDPKGKLNQVGKILVPCSSTQRERYKICGSLPNHLDDKEILNDDDQRENNNTISDTMVGTFGGTLPHKKRSLGVHFSDTGPTGTLDLVKHRSQDSLEGDPWRYQEGVDLDLVRCKHGNYDVVRKNQSADVVDGDSSSKTYGTLGRSSEGKCFRGADLDLVGTLPKRRPGESAGSALRQSFEARQNRSGERLDSGDLLIKVMHKPDCELVKRHQFDRVVDLKLSRLAGGEPQDQGYASERSPEDEHPPSLPGQPFPKVTPEHTFRVTLQKSSRGLGLSVSGGGTAGPVRVKRLFPQQPAALSKKLQSGDILLAANGVPLTGLTNYEALEVLRTTPSTVELVVCRVPGDTSVTSPGAPPPPPARREPPSSLRILNPQPPLQIEPCGEFDIEMTKVGGSLGFTLRKVDSSALGHYVRALVREPALSDGRIQPGDKIVSVDGEPLSPMSHEEAVALLRQCGPRVKLRLYRDLAQTPVSALSPTEPDHPLRPPRTSLRQEAVDMLCDLAVRKLSPDTSHGANSRQTSAASCHSPRRLRKPLSRTPTTENDNENHLTFHPVHPSAASQAEASDTDQCSINTQATNSQSETPANDIIDPPPLYDVCDSSDSSRALSRPSFLDLTARPEKPHFRFSLESESDYTGPIVVTESDSNLTAECDYDDELAKDALPLPLPPPPPAPVLSSDEQDNILPSEPASMPPLLSTTKTTSGAFSYKNPAYQSANPTCGGIENSAKNKTAHSSDQDIPGKVLGAEDPAGSKGLLKWKGVMFAPNDEANETAGQAETEEVEKPSTTEDSARNAVSEDGNEVFTVELTRGWNSRLGFSLQPEGNSTVISVVHPDSVAAKDGRLMEGDVLIMVNDESVENMPTAEIIDLLRKIRGSIGITVRRKNKTKTVS